MTPELEFPPTMAELVKKAAEKYGDLPYLVTPSVDISFTELDQMSRRLAERLLASGFGKGTRIAFVLPQAPSFAVVFAAVTRIGALAIPLGTFLKPAELSRALRHTDAHALLVPATISKRNQQHFVEQMLPCLQATTEPSLFVPELPYLRQIWIFGGSDRPWAVSQPALEDLPAPPAAMDGLLEEVEAEVAASDLMVVIHTSGVTARPKAVVHTHGAQVRHSRALADKGELCAGDITVSTMPFNWVGGLTVGLLAHLHAGATVATVERLDTAALLDLIERLRPSRITGFGLTTRLRQDPTFQSRDLSFLPALHQTIDPRDYSRVPNGLGMSETSGPHSLSAVHSGELLPESLSGSFGEPLPGVQHKIVDPTTGTVLEPGLDGEICVRGYSLMDGLYKRERSEVFDGDGWYHTGDRGHFRDGHLFFRGRLDDMIKTAGANVSPREVEAEILAIPGVKATFVFALPHPTRGAEVAAVICPQASVVLSVDEIQNHLAERLSSYKVPRRILIKDLDEIPFTPTGKVSHHSLRALVDDPSIDRALA